MSAADWVLVIGAFRDTLLLVVAGWVVVEVIRAVRR